MESCGKGSQKLSYVIIQLYLLIIKKNAKNFKCHICKPIEKKTFNY